MTTEYRDVVLADAPVAYWRLGEAAGTTTAVDETGNGHDGTYHLPELGVDGALYSDDDTAAKFDGTDDYVDMGSPDALNIVGDLTIEAWVWVPEISSTAAENYAAIVSWANNFNNFPFHCVVREDGYVNLNRDGDQAQSNGSGLDDGNWHHIVVVDYRSDDEVLFYFDGELDTQKSYVSNPNTGDGFLTLSRSESQFFRRYMDEVAVYDKTLSGPRIKTHYDAAFPQAALAHGLTLTSTAEAQARLSADVAHGLVLAHDATADVLDLRLRREIFLAGHLRTRVGLKGDV